MTAASAPIPQGRHPRFDYIATRLAHWTPALYVTVAVLSLVRMQLDLNTWLDLATFGAPLMVLFLFTDVVHQWHVYALCPVCARKVPLDPPVKIAEKRRRLRSLHWLADRPKIVKYAQWFMLALCLVPWGVGRVAWIALMGVFATLVYLENVHRPLQPWCPQCHWDDGGDEEFVPDPDPVAADHKVH